MISMISPALAWFLLKDDVNFGLGNPAANTEPNVSILKMAEKMNFLNIGITKIHELNLFLCA
jgi:hypothetical protein